MNIQYSQALRGIFFQSQLLAQGLIVYSIQPAIFATTAQGSLSGSTIRNLMLFMCAVKLDLEEEQLAFIRELTTRGEIELAQKEKCGQDIEDRIDPVSDTEEENPISNPMQPSQQQTRGRKRQTSVSSHVILSSKLH